MNYETLTDTKKLNCGIEIPCIGYGTWQTPSGETTKNCVKTAILQGYRHIDTAFIYGNEVDVGLGIKESGVKREEIFLTSKHWVSERGFEKTVRAVETSLKNLGTDYMDLYLIHWPCVEKISKDWKEINLSTWRGLEKMVKEGKIRAIGVSNFQKKHLDALWESAKIKPAVNQIEFHPGYTQMENVLYSQSLGMAVEAWSPLGSGAVLHDAGLQKMAEKYGKDVAQLCVRFALECDVLPLPKSTNATRIKTNSEVFDFALTEEDKQILANYPQIGFSTYLPEDAPADAL